MKEQVWDNQKEEYIEMPAEMAAFLKELGQVCQKHGFSLAHEDRHGSFLIQRYNERAMSCLLDAGKDYV